MTDADDVTSNAMKYVHTISFILFKYIYIYVCSQLRNLRSMKKKFDETDGSMSLMSLRLFFAFMDIIKYIAFLYTSVF